MKVTLLIPVLNEVIGMKEIMPKIKKEWVDQILFIDGQSTDGTIEYLKQHGYEYVVQKKKGMRNAYMESLPSVRGDVIVTFSPDGNSIPELIPECIKKMKEGDHDMVIVSRYAKGAKSQDDDIITGFGNWMFRQFINLCHGAHYTDPMVIYRAFKKKIIFELDLHKDSSFEREEKIFRTNVSWEPLMSIRAAKRRLKYDEIPGDEPPRLGGVRKLQILPWGAAFIYETIREMFVWK